MSWSILGCANSPTAVHFGFGTAVPLAQVHTSPRLLSQHAGGLSLCHYTDKKIEKGVRFFEIKFSRSLRRFAPPQALLENVMHLYGQHKEKQKEEHLEHESKKEERELGDVIGARFVFNKASSN